MGAKHKKSLKAGLISGMAGRFDNLSMLFGKNLVFDDGFGNIDIFFGTALRIAS